MRIRSWLFMGIGYLAGTRAGRERFDDLKNSLSDFAQSDLVSQALGRTRGTLGLDGHAEDAEVHLPEDDEVVLDSDDAEEYSDASNRS